MAQLVERQKAMTDRENKEEQAVPEDLEDKANFAPVKIEIATSGSLKKPVTKAILTAEGKVLMAKRLYFDALKQQQSGQPLSDNHRRAVNFINAQKERYKEAIELHKQGKPLNDKHKAAGILIQQMQKEHNLAQKS